MLTQQENDELTQVGPGTPMGDVLRHYWYPVAFVRELEAFPVKEVRLLGENWAVFRTPSGEYGIVDERCPHRGASLTYGIVEDAGLRCGYHGWLFNTSGECVEILAEPDSSPKFRSGCGVRAGSAQALGGMVWVYVGEGPAPELPRYEAYVMNGYRDIGHSMLPCNWLQIMENAVDPYHVEALHGNYFEFIARRQGTPMPESFVANKHEKVAFDPFDHGIIKRRLLEGQSEDSDDWKIGHPLVFPYKMWVGGNGVYQMQIRVPVDDTHTWALFYTVHAPDGLEFGDDLPVVDYEYQWIDDHGRHIVDYIEGQDVMAWVTQGPVADRVNERITKSDVGILACRRMFKEAMQAVRRGEDPVAVVREPHDVIKLPLERSKFGRGAGFAIDWINDGSMRYSPIAEEMKQLHIDAAAARADLGGS
ncbi:MAG: Rieske 2Fe-2S domain-containing protein [Acidimicrobiaceae bacterium]|nr:Rieske 2Fe-2S domain-containing protein [Acidimicrobiaceae bacterium]